MATPTTIPIPGLSEPSEEEKRKYFSGLTGSPRLVARTSTSPFSLADHDRVSKTMSTLGDHQMVDGWNIQMRARIIDVLTNGINTGNYVSSGLDWSFFYPIRIGDRLVQDTSQHPVVLLIGISEDAVPCAWETAIRIALHCRDIIHGYGWLDDVEVELIESSYVPMASASSMELASSMDWSYSQIRPGSKERDLTLASTNAQLMPLLPLPGCRIEQPEALPGEPKAVGGTLGLFVGLKDKEKMSVYCLTNRHVAVGFRVPGDKDLGCNSDKVDENRLQMLTGGPLYAQDASRRLKFKGVEARDRVTSVENEYFHDPDSAPKEATYKTYRDWLQYIRDLQAKLAELENADTTQRLVGPVVYSPKFGVGRHGDFRDWALVQMAHSTAGNHTNQVYVAEPVTKQALARAVIWTQNWNRTLIYDLPPQDEDGFIRLHGINIPANPYFYDNFRMSRLVAKRGQATGLRYGITNEVEAVRRTPTKDGHSLVSYHLLVLSFGDKYFSADGDSGSCIFDCTGRIVGVVDGGQKSNELVRCMNKYDAPRGAAGPASNSTAVFTNCV